jgi:hypothetical protein
MDGEKTDYVRRFHNKALLNNEVTITESVIEID